MPRVPLLTGPSIRARPLDIIRTTPEAEGGAAAVGLQVAGQTLGNIVEVIDQADKVVAENAEVGYARAVDQIFVNEAQTGFLQMKGTAVKDAYQKLGEEFDRAESDAMKDLNPRQRRIFQQTAARSRVAAMRRADDYLDRELKAVESANLDALQETAVSRVAMDAGDPALAESHVIEVRQRAEAIAKFKGYKPDDAAYKGVVDGAVGVARYLQIQSLVQADKIDQAEQVFKLYGDQIVDPEQKTRAQDLIEQESLRTRAQKESDRIIAESGQDEAAALAKARTLSGTMRDNVEQRITAYYNQQAQIKKQSQNDALDAAAAQLERTGNLNFLRGEQLQTLRNIPGAIAALQQREQQIQRFGFVTDGRTRGGARGGEATGNTDWKLYARLVQDARNNPQALVDINPALVRPYLGNTEFKWFVDARAKAIAGDVEGTKVAGQAEFGVQDLVLGEGRAMGLIKSNFSPSQMGSDDLKAFNFGTAEVRRRIIAAEAKGAIPPAAKLQIVREVMADYATSIGKKVTAPAAAPTAPMAMDVTTATMSQFIVDLGGVPSLSKINRMMRVGNRMQPPAYTDADRQAEYLRIAREP